ncbi:hypothetical protein [Cellulosilyticum ruminicola]|uniref:hypothetical protein n=1 Tax=Cellulosilyticum ruminicola TaxID=425254 RepID=UPI0012EE86B3|nr:hypothetical protein [Cellulosilyticum ruminicola]
MKNKWMNYIVVIIAILAGVVYCIYLQNYNMDFFKSIYKHMLSIYQQKLVGKLFLN